MTKTQAGNALTLADVLKTKYKKWDFQACDHCAIGIARRNRALFTIRPYFTNAFGNRVVDLMFGFDLFSKGTFKVTQPQFRKALLKVIDQEGWEEA